MCRRQPIRPAVFGRLAATLFSQPPHHRRRRWPQNPGKFPSGHLHLAGHPIHACILHPPSTFLSRLGNPASRGQIASRGRHQRTLGNPRRSFRSIQEPHPARADGRDLQNTIQTRRTTLTARSCRMAGGTRLRTGGASHAARRYRPARRHSRCLSPHQSLAGAPGIFRR